MVILIVLKDYKYIRNCMVYGETGVKPLSIDIKCRVISYWSDLVIPRYNKLPCLIYHILFNNFRNSLSVSRLRFQWFRKTEII